MSDGKEPMVKPKDFLAWVSKTAAGAEKKALDAKATPQEARAVRDVVVQDYLNKSGVSDEHLATSDPSTKKPTA